MKVEVAAVEAAELLDQVVQVELEQAREGVASLMDIILIRVL